MQLTQRKQKILSAVAENYLMTGEPVGSKFLQTKTDLNVSSATIRNELADLSAMGYLEQPHTSAGRIPTLMGLRYYIDNLMEIKPINPRVAEYITRSLESHFEAPESILSEASKVVATVTGLTAITTTPPSEDVRVHRLHFVQTGRHTGMTVLVTSSGMIKTQLFRTEFVLTPEMLRVFDAALNECFAGMPLEDITIPFIQTTAASFGNLSLFMPSVLVSVSEAAQQATKTQMTVSGMTNLMFSGGEYMTDVRAAVSFLNDRERLSELLHTKVSENRIFIGEESGEPELKNCSLVVSRYDIAGRTAGAVAAVGIGRIDFAAVMSVVKFTAEKAGNLINELVEV